MKKLLCFVTAVTVLLSVFSMPVYAAQDVTLNIDEKDITHDVSPLLYGSSIEDISYACDGGLVSNLVNNGSFEYEKKPETAWQFENVQTVLSTSDAMNKNNPSYETLTISGKGIVKNLGFTELYDYKTYDYNDESASTADMGFKEGVGYDFSCYVKNIDFEGSISVYLDSKSNSYKSVKLNTIALSSNQWTKLTTTLKSVASEDGGLAIVFEGEGSLQLDFVSLVPQDSYGYGTDEWKYTTLRPDLFQALKNLSPSFIRFPGGCLCEGDNLEKLYCWKDTIGALEERSQTYNVWANDDNGNHYNNTNSMGYHEYFQLCEDLQAKAIPVVNAGITCQDRNGYEDHIAALNKVNMSDSQWRAYLVNEKGFDEKDDNGINEYTQYIESLNINSQQDFDAWLKTVAYTPDTAEFNNYVQDILDLIEYANGDAQTTYWGALRSANGHTQPFNLEYIAIGNENWGDVYFRNFDALYKAVKEKYPHIKIISSAGALPDGDAFDAAWDTVNSKYGDTIVDEHYFTDDDYLFSHNDRYDSYDRDGAGVFVGEYASNGAGIGTQITKNNIWSAVEEAGYMTGFERNSDIVKMASYAPTLAKINANSRDVSLIWFDSRDLVLTPNYYTQMLYSNNLGSQYIDAELSGIDETSGLYQSVTVDSDKQVIYVKLVNSGSKQSVNINVSGFDDINYASNQNFSNKYKSASNEPGKQRIAPSDDELELNGSSIKVNLDKYSVNVIRIAYGSNKGASLYQLPDSIDYKTKGYTPTVVKAVSISACVAVVTAAGAVFAFYSKLGGKSKGTKKKRDNE